MKITIERSKLLKTLTHVQAVVERRNTIPILSNVLLRTGNGHLEMMTTDLDIQIVDAATAEINGEGATTVPAQTFLEIVRKLPEGSQVKLEAANGRMTIVAGRSRFSVGTLPTEDFPVLARGNLDHQFVITTKALEDAFQRTRFAMSTEETRYYLNGVFMHIKDGKLIAAATDGHRLSQAVVDTGDTDLSGLPDIIIPRKTVGEMAKIIGEYEGDIEVSMTASKIAFDIGTLQITSKTIDGTFPDYTRVIPTNNTIIVRTDAKTLASAVDRVSAIASEKTRAVKMKVTKDTITLSVSSPENGTASDEVPCENVGEVEIGFNSRYLMDVLGNISDENVEMRLLDGGAPVLIIDPKRPKDAMVLMPMRV